MAQVYKRRLRSQDRRASRRLNGSGAGARRASALDLAGIFEDIARERSRQEFSNGTAIYSQGDAADSVFYIVKGRVKLAVLSASGKEAVVAILEDGQFFGQGCLLTGHPPRLTTATSLSSTLATRFDRREMMTLMHADAQFTDAFVSYLVAHSGRIEADLVDQLLNSTGKRL